MNHHLQVPDGAHERQDITCTSPEAWTVSVGKRSTLFLVVRLTGDATLHTLDVRVAEEARCTILSINTTSGAVMTVTQKGEVESGGSLLWQNITLGSAVVTHDLVSRVIGANGESAIDWMFYAKGTENQTMTVRNIFDGRSGTGEILMRGVAEEKGHAVAKGMIDIGLQGGGTNTYLTQEVLMLDPSAKVDAVPGLEIKTNDVKASHSATVTRLTPEDLFYFASRGVPKQEARAMYIQGFLGAITERITDEKVKEEILGLIAEKYAA